MYSDAMDAVDVLDSDHRALTSAGWKPGNAGHLHRVERMDQPIDQLAMRRIREQATKRFTALVRMDGGMRYPPHRHKDTEELYVL
jgi:hypothetical protein